MAKKYSRSQYKKERNANKDTRPKATLRNARVSTTKAAFVLDAIRGKDVETALGILLYNPRYASTLIEKLLKSCLLYTSPSPRDRTRSRMPSSA